jgi:hypothetical protein
MATRAMSDSREDMGYDDPDNLVRGVETDKES